MHRNTGGVQHSACRPERLDHHDLYAFEADDLTGTVWHSASVPFSTICIPWCVRQQSPFAKMCWLQMKEEIVRQLPGRGSTSVDRSSDLLCIAGHVCPDTHLLFNAMHPEKSHQHDNQELAPSCNDEKIWMSLCLLLKPADFAPEY